VSDEELRDIIVNFLVAGRDTTACALCWFFYEMARHPDVESKVIEEVDRLMGHPGSAHSPDTSADGEDPSAAGERMFDLAAEMEYTEAALLETLRLHPSVAGDVKSCVEADVLPDGTRVPVGALVSYAPYTFGHSQWIWPDAEKFDCGRWLTNPKPSQYKFPSFNAGPRLCLGKSLALQEAKTLIAMILNRFTLTLKPDREVRYKVSVTLQLDGGLFMQPRLRES